MKEARLPPSSAQALLDAAAAETLQTNTGLLPPCPTAGPPWPGAPWPGIGGGHSDSLLGL